MENETPKVVGKVLDSENSNLTDQQPHFWREPTTVEFKKKNPKTGELIPFERELGFAFLTFVTYLFIPLSVGMFPHLFQHWLTAKSAKSF